MVSKAIKTSNNLIRTNPKKGKINAYEMRFRDKKEDQSVPRLKKHNGNIFLEKEGVNEECKVKGRQRMEKTK